MKIRVKRLNRILSYLLEDMRYMDDDRELPMKWSIMHMYSSTQLASLYALKVGLDPELAGLIACFHDVGTIYTGLRGDHAKKAEPFVRSIIDKYNHELRGNLDVITDDEIDIIIEAVTQHSDKGIYTNKPYVELMKNVDSLDRYLHGIDTNQYHLDRLNISLDLFNIK